MKIVHWISSFKAKRDIKKLNYYLSWCCNRHFKVFDYADCWLDSYTLICIRREHPRRRDGKFSQARGDFASRIGWEIRYRERNHCFVSARRKLFHERLRAENREAKSASHASAESAMLEIKVSDRLFGKLQAALFFSLFFLSFSLSRRARARFGVPAASWRNPLYVYNGYNIPWNSIMLTQPRSNSPGMPACARIVNARRCSIATIPRCLSD